MGRKQPLGHKPTEKRESEEKRDFGGDEERHLGKGPRKEVGRQVKRDLASDELFVFNALGRSHVVGVRQRDVLC